MYSIQKVFDTVKVDCDNGDFLQRVGDIVVCQSGAVLYRQVCSVKKFSQRGRSKSLRIDRVNLKKMLEIAA